MALIVNGERIEDSVIEREAERMRPDYERVFADQSAEEREAQLLDWSKENVVERVLINQEARKNGAEIPKEVIDSAMANLKEQYADEKQLYKDFGVEDDTKIREDIELQLRVRRTMEDVCRDLPKPSKEAVEQYYDENREQFMHGERARVAHIVKYVNWQTDEDSAYQAISEAHAELKGGASFEVVVDKHTDCSDNGGDLGYVMMGQMVEEFEDVVFNLGVGEVSDIFRTRFGFHIAKVYAREPATAAELKEVKAQIVETLQDHAREEAINKFIDALKSKAKIEEA
ncbi:MAG: peptidylprolyl isomerase [Sedimentisphaerales bacterium]|nr:peptidylprolyl isomerase [Sedimentisphaerales bacterium]